jgi:hypothetical protein
MAHLRSGLSGSFFIIKRLFILFRSKICRGAVLGEYTGFEAAQIERQT